MEPDLVPFKIAPRSSLLNPTSVIGHTFLDSGLMPNKVGSFIETKYGIRRLVKTDLARAKGYWTKFSYPPGQDSTWESAPPVHLIATIGELLTSLLITTPAALQPLELPRQIHVSSKKLSCRNETWVYKLPDLRKGSLWFKKRVENLKKAAGTFPNKKHLVQKGLAALDRHRGNYGPEGPKFLQLLWWEWPERLWPKLIDGFPMHFSQDPPPQGDIGPDTFSTRELDAVCDYFDELVSLGVLVEGKFSHVGKIFTVEKPELDGNGNHLLRVISDLKAGGQNAYMQPEPTHLQQSDDILPFLYTGGWSMKVDGSKWFHNFPTQARDRKFLGAVHPKTGSQYVFAGLPMGASSSPGEAGKGEKSFVNTILEAASKGYRGRINHPLNLTMGLPYDPTLGIGVIFENKDGQFLPFLKSHVDDFLSHARTYGELTKFAELLLDTAVAMGIVFNPLKIEPPSQTIKFCGAIYDTTDIPTRTIPVSKISRTLATIHYARFLDQKRSLSCLTLSVLTGLIQSLERYISHKFVNALLRALYSDLHKDSDMTSLLPSDPNYLHRMGSFSHESLLSLDILEVLLTKNEGCRAYPSRVTSMNICWGDGSGTGTGGTSQSFCNDFSFPVTQWKGSWNISVHSFSSNWKELRTILHALQRLTTTSHIKDIQNTLSFIFTDNLVSYWILSSGRSKIPALHQLVLRILHLTSKYGIHLVIIWVPGELMIEEGSDGLSRDLWISPSRTTLLSRDHIRHLFCSAPHGPQVKLWIQKVIGITQDINHVNYLRPLHYKKVINKTTLFTPPPHVTRQILNTVLCYWVEAPLTTSAIFFLPNVYQHDWGRVNKYITHVGTYHPRDLPFTSLLSYQVPLTLLFLPPFIPCTTHRVDSLAERTSNDWHARQAKYVRGLLTTDFAQDPSIPMSFFL